MLKIINDRLFFDSKPLPYIPSPNVGGRMQPIAIVVHDTAGPSAISAINTFKTIASKVSAHFVVDLDGTITQMVDCDLVAWHAGKSVLDGRSGCNSFTVGVEIVNPGKLNDKGCAWFHKSGQPGYPKTEARRTPEHGNGYWLPYSGAQIKSVTELCQALVKAYPTIKQIVPHWYISPRRKIDTNPLFPLEALRDSVFKPQKQPVDAVLSLEVGSTGRPVELAQRRLQELGYPVGLADGTFGAAMRIAVMGFEAENGLTVDGKLDPSEQVVLHSDKAKAMPIAARDAVTVKELATVSRGVSDLVKIKQGGVFVTAASAAAASVEKATEVAPVVDQNTVDQLKQAAEGAGYAKTIAESLGGLLGSMASNHWFQLMVLGVGAYVVATRLLGFKVEDFRVGRWTPSGRT